MRRFRGSLVVVALLAAAAVASVVAQSGRSGAGSKAKPYTTWTAYGGGAHSSQFSALTQINKANVSQLQVAWTYPVNGNDHVQPDRGGRRDVRAGRRATPSWRSTPRPARRSGRTRTRAASAARGMNYWESADRSDRRLIYLNQGNITAIDARPARRSRRSARTAAWTCARRCGATSATRCRRATPAASTRTSIIMSLPAQGAGYEANPADVQAYDVRTGKVAWVFHTHSASRASSATTPGPTARSRRRAASTTGRELTVDEQNGIVFIPTGTRRFDFYGGNRQGDNLFAQQPRGARRADRASGSGTSSSSTTICGTSICRRRRSC